MCQLGKLLGQESKSLKKNYIFEPLNFSYFMNWLSIKCDDFQADPESSLQFIEIQKSFNSSYIEMFLQQKYMDFQLNKSLAKSL